MITSNIVEIDETELRRLFDAMFDRRHLFWQLVPVLDSVQKEYGALWIDQVLDVMLAMELHDAGQFPDSWLDEIEARDNDLR